MPSLIPRSRDPFWDDGRGARRARTLQKVARMVFALTTITLVVLVATHLPPINIDPVYFTKPEARPILGAALFALLGTAVVLALAKMRRADHS